MHTCRTCRQSFESELALELHRDTCRTRLYCTECGARFDEETATQDGWHYRCPAEDCTGEGIGEDLHRVADAHVAPAQ